VKFGREFVIKKTCFFLTARVLGVVIRLLLFPFQLTRFEERMEESLEYEDS